MTTMATSHDDRNGAPRVLLCHPHCLYVTAGWWWLAMVPYLTALPVSPCNLARRVLPDGGGNFFWASTQPRCFRSVSRPWRARAAALSAVLACGGICGRGAPAAGARSPNVHRLAHRRRRLPWCIRRDFDDRPCTKRRRAAPGLCRLTPGTPESGGCRPPAPPAPRRRRCRRVAPPPARPGRRIARLQTRRRQRG